MDKLEHPTFDDADNAVSPRLSGRPLLYDAAAAHANNRIRYRKNGTAVISIAKGREARAPKDNQYDLTQATIFGLNERLTLAAASPVLDPRGRTLRDEFNDEWERYNAALVQARDSRFDYGVYAFYQERGDLVRYCPPFWHRVVSIASSSKLIADPEGKRSWSEIRRIFEETTVAVAGGSVGNSIFHTIIQDLRPQHIKIADKSVYKMENINRVRLQYADVVQSNAKRTHLMETLLRNKALVTAAQAYAIDPYIKIFTYPEGISAETVTTFLDGSVDTKEPPTDIIIEEIDDPRIKIYIREEARTRGIPLLMATDIGSAVQLDVLRYDQDRGLTLAHEMSDDALRQSVEDVYNNPGDRNAFFLFVDALIGRHYRRDELAMIIEGKSEIPTSTMIPQLGSTTALAGAIVAEAVGRIRLGYQYPKRALFNKKTFEASILIG